MSQSKAECGLPHHRAQFLPCFMFCVLHRQCDAVAPLLKAQKVIETCEQQPVLGNASRDPLQKELRGVTKLRREMLKLDDPNLRFLSGTENPPMTSSLWISVETLRNYVGLSRAAGE
jgi:hypothetical protein